MRHGISHPPTPRGATSQELQVIQRLHRAATTSVDEANCPVMLEGVNLLVEMILARNRRQSLTDHWDHVQDGG